MIPLFIWVTEMMSGEKRMINFQYIQQITKLKEGEGSVLYFSEGKKLLVKEALEQLDQEISREAVEIRFECWKNIAEGKELL